MEHLNRRLKEMMKYLGSNIQPHTIKRAGESIGLIHHICWFETKTGIKEDSDNPSFTKDLNLILKTL